MINEINNLLNNELVNLYSDTSNLLVFKFYGLDANFMNFFRRDVKKFYGIVKLVKKRLFKHFLSNTLNIEYDVQKESGNIFCIFTNDENSILILNYLLKNKKKIGDKIYPLLGHDKKITFYRDDIQNMMKYKSIECVKIAFLFCINVALKFENSLKSILMLLRMSLNKRMLQENKKKKN